MTNVKLSIDQKNVLRAVLGRYKAKCITKDQVVETLLLAGVLNGDIIKVSRASADMLSDNRIIILTERV